MNLPNFDRRFSQYTSDWMNKNSAKYATIDEMESEMPEVYLRWLNLPADWLEGECPGTYFQRYSDADELAALLEAYIDAHIPVPDPLLERITDLGDASVDAMTALLPRLGEKRELGLMALGLLREMDSTAPMAALYDLLVRYAEDDEIADLAVETLQAMGPAALEPAMALLDGARGTLSERLLDVCVQYPGHDRVYRKLVEHFQANRDRALYASYLGKYGDDRALDLLKAAIDDEATDYIEYIEMRNAIEQLGGIVESERDFTGDPLYESLRGVK